MLDCWLWVPSGLFPGFTGSSPGPLDGTLLALCSGGFFGALDIRATVTELVTWLFFGASVGFLKVDNFLTFFGRATNALILWIRD